MKEKVNSIEQMNLELNCTGCRMCEKVCPSQAIEMKENEEGFLYPVIDKDKCTNCGLCTNRCPQINYNAKKIEDQKAYAAKINDRNILMESSSGGIFSAIARECIKNNGKVYGAVFDDDFIVKHLGIDNQNELERLRGSKYVQSNTMNTFNEVKQDLLNNVKVVYSGTPCQIEGLKSFLGKEYKNLLTIDLVCHGVPSPKLFMKYKEFLEKKFKSEITFFSFRDKEKRGWGENLKICFRNGKKIRLFGFLDPYYKTFLDGNLCRKCCYNCKYANDSRVGDITLADFWGLYEEYPEFYDKDGVSAVLINTTKGIRMWDNIKKDLIFIQVDLSKIKKHNHNLEEPTKETSIRKNIYKNVDKEDFKKICKSNFKFKKTLKARVRNQFTDIKIEKIKAILKK